MERRRFTREFKLEAMKLIRDRGVSVCAGRARPGCASVGAADLGEGVCGRSADLRRQACVARPNAKSVLCGLHRIDVPNAG